MAVAALLVAGSVAAWVSYRAGVAAERAQAEAEFTQRATLRHVLVREILGRYEDALFGLSALFVRDGPVPLAEFEEAVGRIEGRLTGVQAFQWVPQVPAAERARTEAELSRLHGRPFEFVEFDTARVARRAGDRPHHYPIVYAQPARGNERALGYDLATGPTREFLQRARTTGRTTLTQTFRLIQETGDRWGVVLIRPLFRDPGAEAGADGFTGFLQCVFRVHDLLETAHTRQPETILDMLFLDAAEPDPAQRILYHRPAAEAERLLPMDETEFRRRLHREFALPFGDRDWRVVFRPRDGWLERQRTAMPLLRSGSFLLVGLLLAGLVHTLGRRAELVRRRVEEQTAELDESRRQLAGTLHALPGMAYRCRYDDQLTVLFVSEGAHALTGWTAAELMAGAAHFRDCIAPDDLERVRDTTRRALQDRKDVEVEYRLRSRSGVEKWVLSRGRGVYGSGGELRFFEGLAIDITAQKTAEAGRLALERKLLEGQKLESLGLLAGGIAHDFNNLLSSILGNANLARGEVPPGSEAETFLRAVEAASLRAAELCRQMLAYAGKGRFVVEPTDVTALTEDLLPLLDISVARRARLRLDLTRGLPAVQADATQLRQVVMNLVLNAVDALGGQDGEIALASGTVTVARGWLSGCVAGTELPGGEYVFLDVRDNGCGMTPDVAAKIFDPFFSTKAAGRGLGLAAVLGIVRGHRGALHVTTAPRRGTTFRLLLPPVPAAAPAPRATAETIPGRWRHSANVLVIEDEEPVRTVVAEMLKGFGLTPRTAPNGRAGLVLFREDPAAVDLVLLDLLMPGLSGEQVLAELRAIRPDVRVLLISGYSEGDLLGRLRGPGRLAFLAKPFSRDALEQALRALLGP
jgi:PAS domain S-box-containing protein